MDFLKLAGSLASIAEKLAPAIIPGAGPAIKAGQALITLIHDVRPSVPSSAEASQLDGSLAALEARVTAHAASVENELGDG